MNVKISRQGWFSIGITTGLLALVLVVGTVVAQGPDGGSPTAPTGGSLTWTFTYQGRLQEDGQPANDYYDFDVTIWDHPTPGVGNYIATCNDPTQPDLDNVYVEDGLFTFHLYPQDAALNEVFNGDERWIRVVVTATGTVFSTTLPAQPIAATPYAFSLRPGAVISGVVTGSEFGQAVVNVEAWHPWSGFMNGLYARASSGSAVRAEGNGIGLHASSMATYGILATSSTGTAGYFDSDEGYGIRVNTDGDDHWDHGGYFTSNVGYGVYGVSTENYGVRGEGYFGVRGDGVSTGVSGHSANHTGVWGSSTNGYGVRGTSSSSSGVYGQTSSDSFDSAAGVWGYNGSGGGVAIRGLKYGTHGVAIRGTNAASTGSGVAGESTSYYGVWGESSNYRGVYGRTDRGDNDYGLYTPDNLYSLNYHLLGAVMHVVQNGGREALEPGDVVVFSGMAAPLEAGDPPVVQVARATEANSTAVAGVVYSRFNVEAVTGEPEQAGGRGSRAGLETTLEGPVPTGEYLLLVIQGPAQVRASALSGAIQPGDLLSSAGQDGYAARAAAVSIEGIRMALPGTVFGKALEPLDAGREELIYVFVTLQ